MDRWFETWIRSRWILLLVAVALALVPTYFGPGLSFDRSIENMFSDEDGLLTEYRSFHEIFGANEIVLGVYRDTQVFSPEGLQRLGEISKKVESIDGVREVLSLDRKPINQWVADPDSRIGNEIKRLFTGFTHNAEGTVVAVPTQLVPRDELKRSRREVIADLRDVFGEMPDGMITGAPVMVTDGFRYVEQDGARLGWATSLLLSLVILIVFRSIRWVIVAVVVVQVTLAWTHAVLAITGVSLSMVSSMLAAIVTVISVATVVHYIIRFREHRALGKDPRQALTDASKYLLAPVFWACATDTVGFGALLITKVGPVFDFGVMMSIGAILVVPCVMMVLPALILGGGSWGSDPARPWGDEQLGDGLSKMVVGIGKRPVLIVGITLVTFLISLWGASRLEVESDFTKNFRSSTPIVQAFDFVETELGGAGVWDIAIPAPKTLDWNYIQDVNQLERRLEQVPRMEKVLSLADMIDASLPNSVKKSFLFAKNAAIRLGISAFQNQMPETLNSLHREDPRHPGQYWLRITLLTQERQSAQDKKAMIEEVKRIVEEFHQQQLEEGAEQSENGKPIVTGFFVLLTYLIDSLIQDQWTSFALAILGIGCTMSIAFRSVKLALIAVLPNILPVLVVTGAIGLFGFKINMGAAMIAAVSMGLGVDASIHYIFGFKRAIAEGNLPQDALYQVQHSVGRAVIFSTLALIAGFSILCVSNFVPTIYFGVLVGLTMIGALLGNLIILPLLLQLFVVGRVSPPANE